MPAKKKSVASIITTVRFPVPLLEVASRRAAAQNISRSQYLIELVKKDAKRPMPKPLVDWDAYNADDDDEDEAPKSVFD